MRFVPSRGVRPETERGAQDFSAKPAQTAGRPKTVILASFRLKNGRSRPFGAFHDAIIRLSPSRDVLRVQSKLRFDSKP